MIEYRRSARAVFDIKYHVVWITKYRYKVLKGRVAERTRDLIRQICEARDVVIVRGSVSPDHVHMLLSRRLIWRRRNWCSTSRVVRRGDCKTNSPS